MGTVIMKWRLVFVLMSASLYGFGAASADVVAVVSTQNPTANLTKSQIADIFLGRVHRFPNGEAAVPVDQPEGNPLRDQFYQSFTGWSPAQLKAYWAKIIFTGRGQPPGSVAGNGIAKLLATDPKAIAYVERNSVDDTMRIVGTP